MRGLGVKARAAARARWVKAARGYIPGFIAGHPLLGRYARRASVVFHGSTMLGVDDAGSDVDFWLLLPERDFRRLDRASPSRFYDVKIDGKNGHLNAESREAFREAVRRCDLDAIAQLRYAEVVVDHDGFAGRLVRLARKPMRPAVRRAMFFFHYVEMRGEHRACPNPMARGHSVAVLLSLTKVLGHAMRAALVLDGRPYHYDKWLYRDALGSPTGREVARGVGRVMRLISRGGLDPNVMRGPNPVNRELRRIRFDLIAAAERRGIHDRWLREWWYFMDAAREAPRTVKW